MQVIVEEQRRDYDYLLKIYDRAGAKENVLLTATFGIIAYLYYSPPDGNTGIVQRLFVPQEDYGVVIYIIAAGFFIFALFKLMLNVFGDNKWETAYESAKNEYAGDQLQYVKNRYDACHTTNLESYNKRKRDLRFCFYCILVSAIILIVIKTLK